MRPATAMLLASSLLAITAAASAQQSEPANLCQELLAFAEKKASEPPKQQATAPQAAAPQAAAPQASAPQGGTTRPDSKMSGTQGGGSTSPSSSSDTSGQSAAPPTSPVTTGAAPEAATSPHATDDNSSDAAGPSFAGGVTLQQVRDIAGRNDRAACRDTAQRMRRAGAEMPAALLALAAYDPSRQR